MQTSQHNRMGQKEGDCLQEPEGLPGRCCSLSICPWSPTWQRRLPNTKGAEKWILGQDTKSGRSAGACRVGKRQAGCRGSRSREGMVRNEVGKTGGTQEKPRVPR